MIVFDADSGTVLRTFGLPHGVHNFIFDTDGTALFAFTTESYVIRIDPDRGTVVASINIGAPRGLAWTANHQRLIVGGKNELLFLNPTRSVHRIAFQRPWRRPDLLSRGVSGWPMDTSPGGS